MSKSEFPVAKVIVEPVEVITEDEPKFLYINPSDIKMGGVRNTDVTKDGIILFRMYSDLGHIFHRMILKAKTDNLVFCIPIYTTGSINSVESLKRHIKLCKNPNNTKP